MTFEENGKEAVREIVKKWMLSEEGTAFLVRIHDKAYINGMRDGYDTGYYVGIAAAGSGGDDLRTPDERGEPSTGT